MHKEEAANLHSTHEEADNRMFFHLSSIDPPSNVIVRTADTDCLVIALGCLPYYNYTTKTWMEAGRHSNNTQRYISINQLHENLGELLCSSLIGYHAFTGCDYTSSFSRKGKLRPKTFKSHFAIWQVLKKSLQTWKNRLTSLFV